MTCWKSWETENETKQRIQEKTNNKHKTANPNYKNSLDAIASYDARQKTSATRAKQLPFKTDKQLLSCVALHISHYASSCSLLRTFHIWTYVRYHSKSSVLSVTLCYSSLGNDTDWRAICNACSFVKVVPYCTNDAVDSEVSGNQYLLLPPTASHFQESIQFMFTTFHVCEPDTTCFHFFKIPSNDLLLLISHSFIHYVLFTIL